MSNSTPTSEFVTDTMGLVLRLEGRRMSATARAIFEAVEAGQATLHVPGMVFAEILYLSEKRRISISLRDVAEYLNRYPRCHECPFSLAIAQAAGEITDIPELHDRVIAATARWLGLPLITNDPVIQASAALSAVW